MRNILLILLISGFNILAAIPQTGKDHKLYLQDELKIWISLADENQKLGSDNDKIKAKTQELIKAFAEYECVLGDFPEAHELLEKARSLEKMKPQSPLAKLFIGQIILTITDGQFKDLTTAYRYIDEATTEIRKGDYSSFAKYISSRWLRKTTYKGLRISGQKEKEIDLNHREALLNYVMSENRKNETRFKYEFVNGFLKFGVQKHHNDEFNKKVIQNKDKIDPWLFEMIRGTYTDINGALTIPKKASDDELGKHHTKFQKAAAEHFHRAFKIDPEKPEAPVELMLKTFAQKDDSPRYWFEKAVSIEFDNPKAYSTYLIFLHHLDELRAFGRECSNTGRFDTLVPAQQIETTKKIYKLLKYNYPLIREMKLYDDIHEVFKAYEQNELKNNVYLKREKNYFRARHFGYAFRVGRYTHARKLHQMFGDTLNVRSVLDSFYIDFKTAVPLSYAMSGTASKLVDQLFNKFSWDSNPKESFWRTEKELENYIKMYEEAKAMTSEKESEYFFKVLGEVMDLEKRFLNNEWVNLTFTKDLRLWQVYGGNWKYIDENTVEADNLNSKKQYLSSNGFFKPPYVMEVDVESIKSNWRGNHLQAGLIIGRMYGPKTGRTFWVDGLRKRTGMGIPGQRPYGYDIQTNSKKNKITVYVWPGHAEIYVNDGQTWYTKTDKKFEPLRVGIGIMPSFGISGIARYSNCRIKKIDFGPPPKDDDYSKKLEYYEKRLKVRELKGDFEFKAISLYYLKKYNECLDVLKLIDSRWNTWWTDSYRYHVYKSMKEYSNALKSLESAYKQLPGSHSKKLNFKNTIAWFLATCPDEKIRNIERATKLAKENLKAKVDKTTMGSYLDTYGVCLGNSGKFEEGIGYLKQAQEIFKDNETFVGYIEKRIASYKEKKIFIDEE